MQDDKKDKPKDEKKKKNKYIVKDTVEYPNRTPFPKKRLGGTIVGNHYLCRRFQSLY